MERADLPAFLFSDTPCQGIEGDIQQAGFGASLKCTTFAYRQVGACRDFDLFDPAESVADFEYNPCQAAKRRFRSVRGRSETVLRG